MSDYEYDTFEAYRDKINYLALTEYEETLEYGVEDGFAEPNFPSTAAEFAVEGSNLWTNHTRAIIFHTDEGFYGEGYTRFIEYREFPDNDPHEMIEALAAAAMFNDVKAAIDRLVENREALGDAYNLIDTDAPIWDSGVVFEYHYEKGLMDPVEVTYYLECLGEGEWRVKDPDGEAFEVISPHAIVENATVPETQFKLYLDNLCARREHKREKAEENDE